MAVEPGHIQISEFSKEAIPQINWMLEDLFCRYGTNIPYFCLDYDFPDYSERPDWVSGYNFNLDWGAWGYWLPWFNELLGLLFDTAKLPRWQMPDFSEGSIDMFNSKMSELYEESEPRIFLHCYESSTDDYGIRTDTRNGAYLKKFTTQYWPQENCMCVDSSNNVFLVDSAGGAWNILRKRSKEGTSLVDLTTDYTHGIAISPDGYLYTRQLDGGSKVIVKRSPDDLTAISQIVMASSSRAFTFDSDGYFYVWHDTDIEKWDYTTETKIASHAISPGASAVSFAYANGLIGFCANDVDVYTIPTSLDEDQTSWNWSAIHITSIDAENFILAEHTDSDGYYGVAKYTSTGTRLWTSRVAHYDDAILYGVAAYPF